MRATPPSEPRAKVTAPTPAELRQLIDHAAASRGPANALLFGLATMTGARRGELAALRRQDVDQIADVVHFRRAVKQVGRRLIVGDTKTHQERTVAPPAAAVAMLRVHMVEVTDFAASVEIPLARNPYAFSSTPAHDRPLMPSNISHAFSRTAKACGLDYHLHQLRHFAATQAIAAGYDPVTVAARLGSARLGHADPSVTLWFRE